MKRTVLALLLMAGVAQAGIIGGPPTVPDFPPCLSITTIYSGPDIPTIAQVDVLVDGVVFEQATATPSILGTGWLEFAPVVGDYTFRIYDEGPAVVGSSFWDSYAPLRIGCVEYVAFGCEQTVIPEPAALGLIAVAGIGIVFARRLAM